MRELTDYFAMSAKQFWEEVDKTGSAAESRFNELWAKLDEKLLTQEEASECLDALFIYSHKRIKEYNKNLASVFPTKQYTPNKLKSQLYLWWVDHFTAGISRWSTLQWFSSQKVKKKSGAMGYAGASTHFIQGYHEAPFYIIPLMHGAWHEPARNKDSISIEHVNAGPLTRNDKTNKWHYWARVMPDALVKELPPVRLDKPYRGAAVMQPYTKEQIVNNVKLKRLINCALPGRMSPARMSQHTDWKAGKKDMGPLWPFEECNVATFSGEPIPELDFVTGYEDFLDAEGAIWNEDPTFKDADGSIVEHSEKDNPEYGEATPTKDEDDDGSEPVMDMEAVQTALVRRGYDLKVDGEFGAKTRAAVKDFQARWNSKHPREEQLTVDGIPGPNTCARLKEPK